MTEHKANPMELNLNAEQMTTLMDSMGLDPLDNYSRAYPIPHYSPSKDRLDSCRELVAQGLMMELERGDFVILMEGVKKVRAFADQPKS